MWDTGHRVSIKADARIFFFIKVRDAGYLEHKYAFVLSTSTYNVMVK